MPCLAAPALAAPALAVSPPPRAHLALCRRRHPCRLPLYRRQRIDQGAGEGGDAECQPVGQRHALAPTSLAFSLCLALSLSLSLSLSLALLTRLTCARLTHAISATRVAYLQPTHLASDSPLLTASRSALRCFGRSGCQGIGARERRRIELRVRGPWRLVDSCGGGALLVRPHRRRQGDAPRACRRFSYALEHRLPQEERQLQGEEGCAGQVLVALDEAAAGLRLQSQGEKRLGSPPQLRVRRVERARRVHQRLARCTHAMQAHS